MTTTNDTHIRGPRPWDFHCTICGSTNRNFFDEEGNVCCPRHGGEAMQEITCEPAAILVGADDDMVGWYSRLKEEAQAAEPAPAPESVEFLWKVRNSATDVIAQMGYAPTRDEAWNTARSVAGDFANERGRPFYCEVEGDDWEEHTS